MFKAILTRAYCTAATPYKYDQPAEEEDPFQRIPNELMVYIFEKLSHPLDLAAISLTCKQFYSLIAVLPCNNSRCQYFPFLLAKENEKQSFLSSETYQKTILKIYDVAKTFRMIRGAYQEAKFDDCAEFAAKILDYCKANTLRIPNYLAELLILDLNKLSSEKGENQKRHNEIVKEIFYISNLEDSFLIKMYSYYKKKDPILADDVALLLPLGSCKC